MGRNKYPEVTIEKILKESHELFIEKGYEATTIQDIVDRLGGLTKGAIYYHYKSKEEIFEALTKKMFFANNPFMVIDRRKDLNGLEKMREVVKLGLLGGNQSEMNPERIPLMRNPRLLVAILESNRDYVTPLWLKLVEEGRLDGSIQTDYPNEIAEMMQLLPSVWLNPSIYPMTSADRYRKFLFLRDMLNSMRVPVINDDILAIVKCEEKNS